MTYSVSPLAWLLSLAALCVLLGMSAFFSASEAALFSLTAAHRLQLDSSRRDRSIVELLHHPSRLLTCILMCNLLVNITFFACANEITTWFTELESWPGMSVFFGFAIVGVVILFGELLPKSIAVLAPLRIGRLISIPMTLAMTAIRPIVLGMHAVNDVCRRLILPGLIAESHLETTDLERAIELSQTDSKMINLEKGILQNILQLTDIHAPEWMHPKSQFHSVAFPITKEQLQAWLEDVKQDAAPDSRSRMVLVLSPQDSEVFATTTIEEMHGSLMHLAPPATLPAVFVPWCATLSSVFQTLLKADRQQAIVVNERGDTIGVIFMEDMIEAVFASPSSGTNSVGRHHFAKTGEAKWEVMGTTRIKQLERTLGIKFPETRDATIAGVIQSQLRRIAHAGDLVSWGPYQLVVKDIPKRGEMLVEITSDELDIALESVRDLE